MVKSKVAQAKESMGWTKDAPKCVNCKHWKSDCIREKGWGGREFVKEKNKRCEKGGFATGISCWCSEYERKGV